MSEAVTHTTGERAPSEVWARVASERGLATGALGAIALHLVDDSFLQPEPGTRAAGHLVSGLVPLALVSRGGGGSTRDSGQARVRLWHSPSACSGCVRG